MMSLRTAVFISGRGSNLQALLDLPDSVRVSLVVSTKENVWGLARAKRQGVPALILEKKIDWELLQKELLARRIQQIFLLGFMKIVPVAFLNHWQGRIWNIHPSLLPEFPGLHAIENSYASMADMGVTIHEVDEGMDEGAQIYQAVSLQQQTSEPDVSLERAQVLISRDEQRMVQMFGLKRLSRQQV